MDLTSKKISSYFTDIRLLPHVFGSNIQQSKLQKSFEKGFVDRGQLCPTSREENYRDRLGRLDTQAFKSLILNNFYDPKVMSNALCIADSIFYTYPPDLGSVSYRDRIREWILNLKRIGSESSYGYVFKSDLASADSLFIIKVPRRANEDLLHELFVGLHLNRLRSLVPNFVYTFGGFKCSFPFTETSGEVVSYCNSSTTSVISYVLLENIYPGITFGTFSRTADFTSWLSLYLQVLYALHLANQKLDFTHYDLHDENVIIRSLSGMYSLQYETEKGIEYINTDKIATIIDYGRSHIKVGNLDYGLEIPRNATYNAKFPLHDAYKLLCFSLFNMLKYKNPTYNQAVKILKFFTSDDPVTFLQQQRKYVYSLPNFPSVVNKNILDLTEYIRQYIGIIPVSDKLGPLLLCDGLNSSVECLTTEQIRRRLGIDTISNESESILGLTGIVPQTVFEFYDVASRFLSNGNNEDYLEIYNNFLPHVETAVNQLKFQFDSLLTETTNLINNFTYSAQGTNLPADPVTLTSDTLMHNYRIFITSAGKIYDNAQHLLLYRDAMVFVGSKYNFDVNYFTQEYAIIYNGVSNLLDMVADKVKNDGAYLANVTSDERRKLRLMNKRTDWWWQDLPLLINIILDYDKEITPYKIQFETRLGLVEPTSEFEQRLQMEAEQIRLEEERLEETMLEKMKLQQEMEAEEEMNTSEKTEEMEATQVVKTAFPITSSPIIPRGRRVYFPSDMFTN